MTIIEMASDELIVRPVGLDRVWALQRSVRVPLAKVRGVRPAIAEAREWFHGWRMPGTNIPGVITAGTFYSRGERVFWDVHQAERAIALELEGHRFNRLVVEVADPAGTIARIERIVSSTRVPAVG